MPMKKFIVSARGSVMSVGPHSTMNLSAPSVTPCGIESAYVTHDQTEAMTLGDRVAVMRSGLLQQIGSPQDLYDNPDNPVRRRIHRITGHELLPRNARRRQPEDAVWRHSNDTAAQADADPRQRRT